MHLVYENVKYKTEIFFLITGLKNNSISVSLFDILLVFKGGSHEENNFMQSNFGVNRMC